MRHREAPTSRDVGQHIAAAVLVLAGHDDAGSASSPDVTAGSMATTTRVISGAKRSRLASIRTLQNGPSTRARDHDYLARNWKFESIPLQR
jgi:hypothetical protein